MKKNKFQSVLLNIALMILIIGTISDIVVKIMPISNITETYNVSNNYKQENIINKKNKQKNLYNANKKYKQARSIEELIADNEYKPLKFNSDLGTYATIKVGLQQSKLSVASIPTTSKIFFGQLINSLSSYMPKENNGFLSDYFNQDSLKRVGDQLIESARDEALDLIQRKKEILEKTPISEEEQKSWTMAFAQGIPQILLISIISFLIALLFKYTKIVFSISFFIISIFWFLIDYNCNKVISEFQQKYEHENIQQIKDVLDTVKPNEILEEISDIKNEQLKNLFEFSGRYTLNQLTMYIKTNGLEGIVTQENKTWLNSRDGIQKLYERGQNILQKIRLIDLNKDVDNLMYNHTMIYKGKCLEEYPSEWKICSSVKMPDEASIIFKDLFKNKKDLIEDEFLVIECLYNKEATTCLPLIEKYTKKEENFYNLLEYFQNSIKKDILNSLKEKE